MFVDVTKAGGGCIKVPTSCMITSLVLRPWWPKSIPDSKVPGAYMVPTWGLQDPGGPHVGPMILAIWDSK